MIVSRKIYQIYQIILENGQLISILIELTYNKCQLKQKAPQLQSKIKTISEKILSLVSVKEINYLKFPNPNHSQYNKDDFL